ncbi:hypothetical protein AMK59_6388 [Oryctes borbonicus]|uniref:Uncharacterized protein n=1 Tax=Oryctes borbonicus TaxID=1629725 RepID=A0A0T6AW98_9SCAR|nr:hypothetical protein AMK59_6388 [Oryctes borbonicus]
MPVRRYADPNDVQFIWDSIKSAKHQHQSPDLLNIVKFCNSVTNYTTVQIELCLTQTLKDGLVIKYDSKSLKHPHTDSYRIPTELTTPQGDGKDWYCIECHLAGDVTPCKCCHRVFHAECSRNVRLKQKVFQCVMQYKVVNASSIHDTTPNTSATDSELNESNSNSILSNDEDKMLEIEDSENNSLNQEIKADDTNIKTNFIYDESICSICNLHRLDEKSDLTKEELNHLLGFIMDRIRSWLPSNITHTMDPEQKYEWTDKEDLAWRATQLFYQHMDMGVMQLKLQSSEYRNTIEFIADVMTIQHNVAIFHGMESQEYGAAELMIRDTCHDVSELKTCIDCYKHSNEKINNKWFCLPCRRPHKLVWAKQKGYPYWPAKIIKETDTIYDVRFFGGKYERSILPKNKKNILHIESKPKSYEIKKSAAFNKALEELKLHQLLLEKPNLLKNYIARSVKEESQKKTKSITITTKNTPKIIKKTNQQSGNVQQKNAVVQSIQNQKNVVGNQKMPIKRKSVPAAIVTITKSRRTSNSESKQQMPLKLNVQEIIPISDAEEDELLSLDGCNAKKSTDGCYGQVSSSTEYFIPSDDGFQAQEASDVMHPLEQPYSDAVEKMRRKLEQAIDKKDLITTAMDCMQQEIDSISNEHNEQLKKLVEAHKIQVSETKKKQWVIYLNFLIFLLCFYF